MSKLTSFGSVILLFVLSSAVVVFGFYVFTPKIKAYRALNIELIQNSVDLAHAEKAFDKSYAQLQNLQEREKSIDIALHKHFDVDRFESYLKRAFASFSVRSVTSEKSGPYQVEMIAVHATLATPTDYYRFIDALNLFEWVAEVEGALSFTGAENGIDAHFKLKVRTVK